MPPSQSLTPADALRALREDIQAENTLIASRVTWYVTSQAFLLTAYATSWNVGFVWSEFFHRLLPIAAIVLSIVILASIYAATWAQGVYLREQAGLVLRIRAELILEPSELLALEVYERTMVRNRTNAAGKVIGTRIHALVRVTPLLLPVGFSALWFYAYHFAPVAQ
ncbi:MAG TPA: hypothetical protein VEV20_12500 [Burkholderiales bacterium]|nr:hypothetical protein [Burkholderiales bacterium]